MFDVEILDKCTLRQACEWIAFKWAPMPPQYEAYCDHIRPANPHDGFGSYITSPSEAIQEWNEYNKGMQRACSKLTIALLQKAVIARGSLRINKKYMPTQEKQVINFHTGSILDWDNNQIRNSLVDKIGENDLLIEEDIEIDFALLRKVFPQDVPEHSQTILKLAYEDSSVYLYTGDIQKTLIKKFAKNDNKSRQVIEYIIQHPGKLITRDEIIQCGIKGFDKADRIDNILKNAFANLNIYKCFFKNPKTASVEFIEQITNLDIDSDKIDMIIIK